MLSVLRHGTYRRLFAAQVVALPGTGLLTVALGLLAFDTAGKDAGAVIGTAPTIKMVAAQRTRGYPQGRPACHLLSLHDGHLVRLIRETINHADHRITGNPATTKPCYEAITPTRPGWMEGRTMQPRAPLRILRALIVAAAVLGLAAAAHTAAGGHLPPGPGWACWHR